MSYQCSRLHGSAESVPRRFLLATVFVTILVVLCPRALSQQNDLKQVASSLAHDIDSANRHTITVADFTDLQGNVTELGRYIAEELSTQLVMDAKSYTVVERIQLAAILKEHQISISGLVDPATIRKLGQFAGVDAIVTGTLVPFSDSVRLNAKVLDISTARVLAVSSSDLPRTKAIDDLLSRGITNTPSGSSQNQPDSVAPSRSAQLASLTQSEFLFVVKRCVRTSERVLCSGSITNIASKARGINIRLGRDWTLAIDNNGNSYTADQVAMGQIGGGYYAYLMPDLPMNFFIQLAAADPSATQINLILAYDGDGVSFSKALLRNIPLTSK